MAGLKKRADGRYLKMVTDPRTKKRLCFYGSSEKEITRKILQFNQALEKGRLFEDVAVEWYDEAIPALELQSVKSYRPCYKAALEEFTGMYIKEIKPKEINSYLRKLALKGYSAKSVSQRRLVLNLIFRHAIIAGDIDINPCSAVITPKDLPKQARHSASESDEQIIKKSADIWIFPYIALMTGMRKGEILALQWKDIDFENNIISVTKSVCHNGDRPIIKTPKTEESTRYVPLLLPLREKLLGYHNKHPESFIVSDDGTSPLSNRRFITLSKKFKEATGTTCTAHELRHSFATVAIENDIPPKVVQEILGHKQLSTTMDIYADLRKKSIIAAADKLNKMVE